jgi:hypothetical protein
MRLQLAILRWSPSPTDLIENYSVRILNNEGTWALFYSHDLKGDLWLLIIETIKIFDLPIDEILKTIPFVN